MNVSYDGIGAQYATFPWDSGKVGDVCSMMPSGKVGIMGEDAPLMGVICDIREGYATVQYGGFARVRYAGETPALGVISMHTVGTGVVMSGYGDDFLCVSVDEANQTAVIKL